MRCCHPGRFEAQVMMSPSIVMNYDLTAWIQRITRWSDTRPPLNSTIKNPYPKKLQKTIYCRIGVYPRAAVGRTLNNAVVVTPKHLFLGRWGHPSRA